MEKKKMNAENGNNNSKKNKILHEIKMLLMLTLAAFIAAFNLSSVLKAGNLLPGGFSGITVLIQQLALKFFNTDIPFSMVYLPLNIIPVYIGFRYIGKKFTLLSLYVTVLTSILTDILPSYPITYDIVLIGIFGGLIGGTSGVIMLLSGASGGGTDFISIYFSEKKGINTWNYILAANVVILLTAGVIFGFDRALYSIIYQYVSTQVLNTMYKRYQKDTLLIVTEKPDEVYKIISDTTSHDATHIEATGCYKGAPKSIIYSVVGRDQVDGVSKAIRENDAEAFINIIRTEEINGFFDRPEIK